MSQKLLDFLRLLDESETPRFLGLPYLGDDAYRETKYNERSTARKFLLCGRSNV
jgi:hypothetical protein